MPDEPSGPLRILWAARFDYRTDDRLAVHHHDHHQAILVLSGRGRLRLGHDEVVVKPGLALIPPGLDHGLEAHREIRTLDCKFRVTDRRLAADLAALPPWQNDDRATWRATLQAIIDDGRRRRPWFRAQAEARLLLTLVELVQADEHRAAERAPALANSCGDELVDGLLERIAGDLGASWDQRRIEQTTGYSYRQLANRCRQALGQSPTRLVEQLRIERARELLRVSDYTVAAIAERCGFSSAQYLARRFKAATGTSPEAWRQRERAGVGRDVMFTDDFVNRLQVE